MIDAWMTDTVYVRQFMGEENGDAIYGIPVEYPCSIQYDTARVLNARGDEVTSIATIFIDADISPRDKLILPYLTHAGSIQVGEGYDRAVMDLSADELNNISRTPIKVVRINDPTHKGTFHHAEVMV